MSEESVSVREFERWARLNTDMQKQHNEELKSVSKELKESNEINRQTVSLLREDIATTKVMMQAHIDVYNTDKIKNSETFSKQDKRIDNVEETLKEREGVYNLATKIKWALAVITTGFLAAFGKDLAIMIF